MTTDELVGRVAAAGYAMELTPHGPRLVRTRDDARLDPELLALVKAHREAIITHLRAAREPETEGERCGRCAATVYHTGPEIVRMCGMVTCPYWTPASGIGADWWAKEREALLWRERHPSPGRNSPTPTTG